MKKLFLLMLILINLLLLNSCGPKFYLTEIVFYDYDSPFLGTYVNGEIVEESFVKDATLSIYEITEEEYNKRNGENAFIEILSNTEIKGRYIGLNFKVLIDEEIGYQDMIMYDITYHTYSTGMECKLKLEIDGKYVLYEGRFSCQDYSEICNSFFIYFYELGEIDQSEIKKYQFIFVKPELFNSHKEDNYQDYNNRNAFEFELKVITKEEYDKKIGTNVFKQETWGELANIDRYIEVNIISRNKDITYEISNLRTKSKYGYLIEGDLIITKGDQIIYATIEFDRPTPGDYSDVKIIYKD